MFRTLLAATVIFSMFNFSIDHSQLEELTTGEPPGTIQFIGNAGSNNVFTIEHWNFTKAENLNTPEKIKIEAILDMRSITTKWKELEQSLLSKKDYFYVKKFPEARISINGSQKTSNGYKTTALLTLKGIEKDIQLDFTISEKSPFEINASGIVNRLDFKFKDKGPKDEVPVTIKATIH